MLVFVHRVNTRRYYLFAIIMFTGLRERHKRGKSEEKIDCHHQDSNQGPSLVASDALTTELWCSRAILIIILIQ